jgi:hypothetical protein
MKNTLLLLSIFLISTLTFSQNLVQNGDFEDLNNEPCGLTLTASEFDNNVLFWVVANLGTPDVFLTTIEQACWNYQPNSTYPGPIGIKGSQDPHSGEVFLGIFAYTISDLNQRDYIQVQLSEAMQEGSQYIVEFYVSLADSSEFSVDNVGAYLSSNPVYASNDGPLDYEPQVQFTSFIDDTENWIRIADTITAGGNYEYITIGNFNDDANTSTQENPPGGGCVGCYGAYYFIDDVSVSELITTGINDPITTDFTIYPNPFHSTIKIQSNHALINTEFNILDASGKVVQYQKMGDGDQFQLDLNSLSKGVYFLEIKHSKGTKTHRIMKLND